jgi:hypothetical protein
MIYQGSSHRLHKWKGPLFKKSTEERALVGGGSIWAYSVDSTLFLIQPLPETGVARYHEEKIHKSKDEQSVKDKVFHS